MMMMAPQRPISSPAEKAGLKSKLRKNIFAVL
jgi:hypothetical protein